MTPPPTPSVLLLTWQRVTDKVQILALTEPLILVAAIEAIERVLDYLIREHEMTSRP